MDIGFAVMCSSIPKLPLNTHSHIFLLIFRAQAQCAFRYNKAVPQMAERDPPADREVQRWVSQFKVRTSVEKRKSAGRPRTSQEDAERTRLSCRSSPMKSIVRRCW